MSKIQWTDKTDNPLTVKGGGHYCEKCSPGCQNCYSEKINKNPFFKMNGQPYKPTKAGPPEMVLDADMLASWARARKPKKRFICSMTDMFGEWVPDEMIFQILDAMASAPKQTFQILTKRAERMRYLVNYWLRHRKALRQLPPNIWLGISAEDQQRLDERLIWLIRAQAQTRFLSLEPLLGPITLPDGDSSPLSVEEMFPYMTFEPGAYIDWVIIGGESGPSARPMDLIWIESILDQCKQANIPVFIKQMGAAWAKEVGAKHPKGGDWAEWHPDFLAQMWPGESWFEMAGRCGE